MKHSFQIRTTTFLHDNQQTSSNATLQIVETTCVHDQPINRNNVIEGNNLIYLAGAFVAFENFFQTNNIFASCVSWYGVVGMAGNNSGKGNVAIATYSPENKQLQIAIYSCNSESVPTHRIRSELQFIDMVYHGSNCLLIVIRKEGECSLVYLKEGNMIETQIDYQISRMFICDQTVCLICDKGLLKLALDDHMAIESSSPIQTEHHILDYLQVEGETRLILTQQALIYTQYEQSGSYELVLSRIMEPQMQVHRMVKVGRNILLAHSNSITLTHIIIKQESLHFVAHYTHDEKLSNAGILSIQSSRDQMHIVLAVSLKQQSKVENFLFNLPAAAGVRRCANPFTRLLVNGSDSGQLISMQNAICSNFFLLIGNRISSLQYESTLEKQRSYSLYETPRQMVVHPLGYQFLLLLDKVVKFYNRIDKDMQEIWHENYNCVAAKYSSSGNLVLCTLDDSSLNFVLYDCYNFRPVRIIPNLLLKLNVTRIEWGNQNCSLTLFSPSEVLKISLFNGQKIMEFKVRSPYLTIKCLDYDAATDQVIAFCHTLSPLQSKHSFGGSTDKQNFILSACRNEGESDSLLSSLKLVQFPQVVSVVKICSSLNIVFLGTVSGRIYSVAYPLHVKVLQQCVPDHLNNLITSFYTFRDELTPIKLHQNVINFLDITKNHRFLIAGIKKSGYFMLRTHKQASPGQVSKNDHMNLVFQQLGNPIFNTIQISSETIYDTNKQKLKTLLDKRKSCFNELQEFRKQWELKVLTSLKTNESSQKKQQLNYINKTLQEISQIKSTKKMLQQEKQQFCTQLNTEMQQSEQQYEKTILTLYSCTANEQQQLLSKRQRYNKEYEVLKQQCKANLKQIQHDLKDKFDNFVKSYEIVKQNLLVYKQRIDLEKEQEKQETLLELQEFLNKLELHEIQLNSNCNELSVKIAQLKKQKQRFVNRRSFLEHKNRFFVQEISGNEQQEAKLREIKQSFEHELRCLGNKTEKKEKKLKFYLKANDALAKYKSIYDDLENMAIKDTEAIQNQQLQLEQEIKQIQNDLSKVATNNKDMDMELTAKFEEITKLKEKNRYAEKRMNQIEIYLGEISASMQSIESCKNQEEKISTMKEIYEKFYIRKNVEVFLRESQGDHVEGSMKAEGSLQQSVSQKSNENQQHKILTQLQDHQTCLINKFQLAKKQNERIKQEINLNYLQIQSQNYGLIAQCNSRKDQTAKKKKIFHELIDSVKETQIYLDNLQSGHSIENVPIPNPPSKNIVKQLPFTTYEKLKQEEYQLLTNPSTKFSISRYHVRKILDINKVKSTDDLKIKRRIQTAVQKKRIHQQSVDNSRVTNICRKNTNQINRNVYSALKSANAHRKLHSTSKPSISTNYTKNKNSIFI